MAQTKIAAAVSAGIDRAVNKVASDPTLPLSPEDVWIVSDAVTAELRRQAAVQHATNTEPWYSSRVTLGALSAIFAGIGGVLFVLENHGFSLAQMWPHLTAIGGGLFTLYGRWIARAPLGKEAPNVRP